MLDRTENQPPSGRQGVAPRHLCAVPPMLFHGAVLTSAVSRNRDRPAPAPAVRTRTACGTLRDAVGNGCLVLGAGPPWEVAP